MTEEKTYISVAHSDKDQLKLKGAEFEQLKKDEKALADTIDKYRGHPKVAKTFIGKDVNVRVSGEAHTAHRINDTLIEKATETYVNTTSIEERVPMSDEKNGSFDTFYKEIKEDLREREGRTREEIKDRETRFDKQLEKFHEDGKEREDRIFNLFQEIKNENHTFRTEIRDELRDIKKELKEDNQNLKNEFDVTKNTLSDLTKHNESLATTNKWSNVTTIIGIGAIVVAVIVALITFMVSI